MTYLKDYKHLISIFNKEDKFIEITKNIKLLNLPFNSINYKILPGKEKRFFLR